MSTETVTALGLIVALAAVFYQARGYHLSRRELSLKVEDLSSIVHRLEGEIAARQALDEKHTRLMVASLNGDAQALSHATQISGIIQGTVRELSRNVDGTVADIKNILVVHNAVIANESYRTRAAEAGLFAAIEKFCHARIAQMACGNEWDQESQKLREHHLANQNPDKLIASEELVRFEHETAAYLAGKYTDRLRALNSDLIEARDRFLASADATFRVFSPDRPSQN